MKLLLAFKVKVRYYVLYTESITYGGLLIYSTVELVVCLFHSLLLAALEQRLSQELMSKRMVIILYQPSP